MTKEELKEELQELLHDMDDDDLIQVHNEYCDACNCYDDEIYYNDEDFFNTYFEGRPMEVARACYYGKYEFMDEYVIFNGYGNLESFTYNLDDYIYIDDIVDYIIENDEAFFNDDILDALEEYKASNEEDEEGEEGEEDARID